MYRIVVPENEWYDEDTGLFKKTKETALRLEHSLISVSLWESKWKKSFLNPKTPISREEFIDYIRCMTLDRNVDSMVYYSITDEQIKEIQEYINDPMTATWFADTPERKKSSVRSRTITSELVYYWMTALNIPSDYQKWHLNRLLTLIDVCKEESNPKKMSKKDLAMQNRQLNEARKKARGTKG